MVRMDVDDARSLARELLEEALPQRWRHVQAVARRAEALSEHIEMDRRSLVCAAWLHDIGYSPRITDTGFHPLDGARYLRSAGWPAEIYNLVAHHSCARAEAERRGVAAQLCAEFADHHSAERDALWAADATTGPAGQEFSLDERVKEVVHRYGPDHLVAECMLAIQPELEAAISRTAARAKPAVG
jgi:putative nucleotidyltransferase with HDIG domain